MSYTLKITPFTKFRVNKTATSRSQNFSSGSNFINTQYDSFNCSNSSQISFGSKNPYEYGRFSELNKYLDEDMFIGNEISGREYDLTKKMIDVLHANNNINDIALLCAKVKGYELYDGGSHYFMDQRNTAYKYALDLLEAKNSEKDVEQFKTMFNIYNQLYPDTQYGRRYKHAQYNIGSVKKDVSSDAALGRIKIEEALYKYQSGDKRKFYNSYEAKMRSKQQVDKKYEDTKDQLRPFLKRLASAKAGKPAAFPNCIMLIGENRRVATRILDWMYNSASSVANFIKIERDRDCNKLQDNLITALEEAEKNYQQTNERSVIFVERFDRLLNPKLNSSRNIASIKDYMSAADEDYHSTIVFFTPDCYMDNLDRGTIQPHRVGLKVHIPVKAEELDLI